MLFGKKNQKKIKAVWTVAVIIIISSMVLAYLSAFIP